MFGLFEKLQASNKEPTEPKHKNLAELKKTSPSVFPRLFSFFFCVFFSIHFGRKNHVVGASSKAFQPQVVQSNNILMLYFLKMCIINVSFPLSQQFGSLFCPCSTCFWARSDPRPSEQIEFNGGEAG